MKIFGSDGFRSKYGEKYLTKENINLFAISISYVYRRSSKPILIARDTRYSGVLIEKQIVKILNSSGLSTVTAGVIPSPCVSSILKSKKYAIGIMITASHNPAEDNGIKLFSMNGSKLEKKIENVIEKRMIYKKHFENKNKKKGKNKNCKHLYKYYLKIIKNKFSYKPPNHKIVIDCSNGAYSKIITDLFRNVRNIKVINNKPNGKNINFRCGALHPKLLYRKVVELNFDYGIAFDGDGDRAIFVGKKNKGVIETEKLLIFFSRLFKYKKNKYIVSSEICNFALKLNSKKEGFKLVETSVGDRYVIDKVNKISALIGAEPSGHYYIPKSGFTMDGLAAAMCFFQIIKIYGEKFSQKLNEINSNKRLIKNIPIKKISSQKIKIIRKKIKKEIDNKNEKLIIRLSMWDPVMRIYYDFVNKNNFNKYLKLINNSLNS